MIAGSKVTVCSKQLGKLYFEQFLEKDFLWHLFARFWKTHCAKKIVPQDVFKISIEFYYYFYYAKNGPNLDAEKLQLRHSEADVENSKWILRLSLYFVIYPLRSHRILIEFRFPES